MEYGLIGERLGHSFSKAIHNRLYGMSYELKEIAPCEVEAFIKSRAFRAINVTIPYKQTVMPLLDEIDPIAQSIGAVNTVVNRDGRLYGYNTDFSGLRALILRAEIELKNKKVLILGSGGTSKTAIAVAKDLGAKEVLRVSRSVGDGLITYNELSLHRDAQAIINTTPCGMYPNIGTAAVEITDFPDLEGVIDAIYNPLNSKLVTDAEDKGIKAVGGLYMLVAQGVFAAEKFLNRKFSQDKITEIYSSILKEKLNLVLIGMPSSGKSTVGKALAGELNKDFLDTDTEIEKREKNTIPQIFESKGEKGFREIEAQVIKELSALQGKVIATGGGAVLNPENIKLLRENGIIIFLNRNLENLITTDDRPLSSNKEDLKKRYNERYEIYMNSADFVIDANGSIEENVNSVKEVLKLENFSD